MNSHGERETARGQRPVGGALHARVGGALEALVERARAGGNEADAEQHVEQAALQGGDAGLHRPQVKAAPAGDEHQADDFDFEEFAQVVDEGCGGAGLRGVKAVRVRGVFAAACGEICGDCGLGGRSHGDVRRELRLCERWGSGLHLMITSGKARSGSRSGSPRILLTRFSRVL